MLLSQALRRGWEILPPMRGPVLTFANDKPCLGKVCGACAIGAVMVAVCELYDLRVEFSSTDVIEPEDFPLYYERGLRGSLDSWSVKDWLVHMFETEMKSPAEIIAAVEALEKERGYFADPPPDIEEPDYEEEEEEEDVQEKELVCV